MNAPIALFAYKRAKELAQVIAALQANYLAAESDLYVFVDGPRRPDDVSKVEEVRALVHTITGFRSVQTFISETNKGCANSIIGGVSQVLATHETVIVVEDDIVTTPNFLDYINQALQTYKGNKQVFSIGGYSFPFEKPTDYPYDGYFIGRTCAWGWGIWADRWEGVDWNVSDFAEFMQDTTQQRMFNRNGSDRVRMLRRTMQGEVDTWDIKLCYAQFKQGTYTLYPTVSKVSNIGFYSGDENNTSVYNRYKTRVDEGAKRRFSFAQNAEENRYYVGRFREKFSVSVRAFNRLRTLVGLR